MCTVLAVGLLLLAVLAGYMVLLKACAQEGKLKVIGQVISWIVIIIGFIGIICSMATIHCYSGWYNFCKKGNCNIQGGAMKMKMSKDVKEFLGKMPFIPMSTQGKDGPHLIVVGKGIVIDDETVAFFGWRQSRTSENIRNNGVVQIAVVSEQKNSGYRLAGKGHIETEGRIYDSLKEKFPEQMGNLGFVTVMKVEQIEPLI